MFIAKNNDIIIEIRQTKEDLIQSLQHKVYTSIEETETEYYLYNGQYLTEEEIEEQERIRVGMLTLTRGDVFTGLIQARMADENVLKAQLEQMPEDTPEQKVQKMLALNALTNALNFHRGHDLVNIIGAQLGISSENLDNFFETNDYHFLLPEEPEEPVSKDEDVQ